MRLLLSIFISFIVTPVSFAGTDLTGKTLICETIDDEFDTYITDSGPRGFINKWVVIGFLDETNVVKLEYGYDYKMTNNNIFEKDYLLGGVLTMKEGVYKEGVNTKYIKRDDSFLYLEFKKTVKESSYENKYEQVETDLTCKSMKEHGRANHKVKEKNKCNIELLDRQTLKLVKTYVGGKGHLLEYDSDRTVGRANCKLGDDNNLKIINDVVRERWVSDIQKGMADTKRKIQEKKSKNKL